MRGSPVELAKCTRHLQIKRLHRSCTNSWQHTGDSVSRPSKRFIRRSCAERCCDRLWTVLVPAWALLLDDAVGLLLHVMAAKVLLDLESQTPRMLCFPACFPVNIRCSPCLQPEFQFSIRHYAGTVVYSTAGTWFQMS